MKKLLLIMLAICAALCLFVGCYSEVEEPKIEYTVKVSMETIGEFGVLTIPGDYKTFGDLVEKGFEGEFVFAPQWVASVGTDKADCSFVFDDDCPDSIKFVLQVPPDNPDYPLYIDNEFENEIKANENIVDNMTIYVKGL